MTEIDGVDIHFIHVRSQHEDALPLIMTHGWPGSVIELLDVDRPADRPDRARRPRRGRVPPRDPVPARLRLLRRADRARLGPGRVARAWAELMQRLGYTRYVAQGGDVGAGVTDAMGRQAPDGLIGIHTNLLVPALDGTDCRRTPTRNAPRPTRSHVPGDRLRLLRRAGDPAADDRLRPARLPGRPRRLDARPRHRRLLQDRPRLRRRASRRATSPATTSSTTSRSTG